MLRPLARSVPLECTGPTISMDHTDEPNQFAPTTTVPSWDPARRSGMLWEETCRLVRLSRVSSCRARVSTLCLAHRGQGSRRSRAFSPNGSHPGRGSNPIGSGRLWGRGFVEPWRPEAKEQNRAVLGASAAAAVTMVVGGYTVVLDGVIGPWNLDLVLDQSQRLKVETHYVILRPSKEVTLARGTTRGGGEERIPGHPELIDEGPILHMWEQFASLGPFERSRYRQQQTDS